MPNTAIIVAAGSGERFGGDRLKQFIPILGEPLIVHTLRKFEECLAVDEIVLVLSEAGMDEFADLSSKFEIAGLRSIVAGGETRARSVKNGLDVIDGGTARIVAVHDGARPLVTVDEITRTVREAERTGAACLVGE